MGPRIRDKNEQERELLLIVNNEIIPKTIEYFKSKIINHNYFKLVGLSKRVYEEFHDCDLNIKLCSRLIRMGIEKTFLGFDKVGAALDEGASRQNF